MKYSVSNPPLQCFMTHSTWWDGAVRDSLPIGVLWHDTDAGNPYLKRYVQPYKGDADYDKMISLLGVNQNGNDWNHAYRDAGLNAFIGQLADGTLTSVQVGEWTMAPWGCGMGPRGSCNGFVTTHGYFDWIKKHWIQFEICDDGYNSREYFEIAYEEACQLTAYLCYLYDLDPRGTVTFAGIDVPVILCHQDSYRLGLGNNHGDVLDWFAKFGKTMNDVREHVYKILVETAPIDVSASTRRKFAMTAVTETQSYKSSNSFIQNCSSKVNTPAVSATSSSNCSTLISKSVADRLGIVLDTYSKEIAMEGDILCLSNSSTSAIKTIDYMAIVTQVLDNQVLAISNTLRLSDNSISSKETTLFAYSDPRIVKVYRPKFEDDLSSLYIDPLEAALRQFASIDNKNEPSINISSDVGLSLINYMAASNFVQIISGTEPEVIKQRIIDVMMSVPRIIVEYLQHHNFTLAAGIGICANMYCDSRWKASFTLYNALNVPVTFGLCRWSGERAKQLQTYSEWQTSISAQLDFLINELFTTPKFNNLYLQTRTASDPVWFAQKFYQTYYDVTPTDTEMRQKAAQLLWSMTKEAET